LAARVAQIIGADILIIFSDVDGLYDKSKVKKL
jgi:glutamate 5-kinase